MALTIPVATFRPPRIVLNAVEGWGKTSTVAHAPDAGIIMCDAETGYSTLLGAGRVPAIATAHATTWQELLDIIAGLKADPGGIKVLGIDALSGAERLCYQCVCDRDFKSDWTSFYAYAKGPDLAVNEWMMMLAGLDALRQHGIAIMILSHAQVRPYANPTGTDFDRYTTDTNRKTWSATTKWADAVLFGEFYTVVEEKKGKRPKGTGGTERILHTERRDAYDAKNRYGMPEVIDIENDPSKTWGTIWNAIKGDNK